MSRQLKMISEWPRNLIMSIFMENDKCFDYVNTSKLEDALGTFPEGEFVLLRYKEGLTIREIGERLNVTYDMARNRVDKGLRKIHHPALMKKFYNNPNYDR